MDTCLWAYYFTNEGSAVNIEEGNVEDQKKFLSERLTLETLRSGRDKKAIEQFEQAACGSRIAEYLINDAWEDDENRNTKVYLVKDKITKEIVYYFAINCGIIYSELGGANLSDAEKDPFERYIAAIQDLENGNNPSGHQNDAESRFRIAMEDLIRAANDPDRATYLLGLADDKAVGKQEENERFAKTAEQEHTMNVQDTFPAIDIKFLCRNKNYHPDIKLNFKIGIYIFWEIIVPRLLKIADAVGCRYVYLFAADNSEMNRQKPAMPVMYTQDFDPYADDEDENEEKEDVLQLVSYYQRELKFEPVTEYKILKPRFERTCFTLIQEVDKFSENRESVWAEYSSVNHDS